MEDSNWFLDSLPGAWAALTEFVTAFGPLAVAVAVLFIGARITKKREHESWLRNKRLEALTLFLSESFEYTVGSREVSDKLIENLGVLIKQGEVISVLGPEKLSDEIHGFMDLVLAYHPNESGETDSGHSAFVGKLNRQREVVRKVGRECLITSPFDAHNAET